MKIKYIIIMLFLSIFLVGCGKDTVECEDCDSHITQKNDLSTENNRLRDEIINLKYDLLRVKENQTTIKDVYTNNTNQTTIYIGDCTTCTRMLNEKERQLEACWNDDSYSNYRDLYYDCRSDRKELREENNNTIEQLEEDLLECDEFLEVCEDELSDC